MTYRGNEASWRKVDRAKANTRKQRRYHARSGPWLNIWKSGGFLSIDITSFSNAVVDAGAPLNMHLEFNRGTHYPLTLTMSMFTGTG